MTEHLPSESKESFNNSAEIIEPRTLAQSELDDIELTVRELLETEVTHNDLRAVVSSLLEEKGQLPLGEEENQRQFQIEVDGEVVEKNIYIDPSDFGTVVRPLRLEDFTADTRSLDTVELSEPAGVAEAEVSQEQPVESDMAEQAELNTEQAALDREEIGDEQRTEADAERQKHELIDQENQERLRDVRNRLNTMVEDAGTDVRIMANILEDLTQSAYRQMINTNDIQDTLHSLQRKLSESSERSQEVTRYLQGVTEEFNLDVDSGRRMVESIDQAIGTVRRAGGQLEDEAATQLRMLQRQVEEAQYGGSAEEIRMRIRQLSGQFEETIYDYRRKMTNVEL